MGKDRQPTSDDVDRAARSRTLEALGYLLVQRRRMTPPPESPLRDSISYMPQDQEAGEHARCNTSDGYRRSPTADNWGDRKMKTFRASILGIPWMVLALVTLCSCAGSPGDGSGATVEMKDRRADANGLDRDYRWREEALLTRAYILWLIDDLIDVGGQAEAVNRKVDIVGQYDSYKGTKRIDVERVLRALRRVEDELREEDRALTQDLIQTDMRIR
jgi:hypothetical protein